MSGSTSARSSGIEIFRNEVLILSSNQSTNESILVLKFVFAKKCINKNVQNKNRQYKSGLKDVQIII